ncbi:hypothetical protein IWQ61_005769 [Dispira simplex]|nr:hypothetical protein IWQ61_005769 [Dispira simplex]
MALPDSITGASTPNNAESQPDSPEFENAVDAVPITLSVLQSMRVAKVFHNHQELITSLAFDSAGEVCITTSTDDSLQLYNCRYGRLQKTLYSKKYGADLARFTHHPNNIVYASAKGDDHALRYLLVHDNQYLMYFVGHDRRVVSLSMSPTDDLLLSASLDQTVRLWDLRSPNCQGLMHLPPLSSSPCVDFDPCGVAFGVGIGHLGLVRLYDVKNMDKGPFTTFRLADALQQMGFAHPLPGWTGIRFSPDGKRMLLITPTESHLVIDAYTGDILYRLVGHVPLTESRGGEASFSPDGEFIVSGSQDGTIHVWKLDQISPSECVTLQPVCSLDGHLDPSRVVGFNPRYMMLASGSVDLAFWEPEDLR